MKTKKIIPEKTLRHKLKCLEIRYRYIWSQLDFSDFDKTTKTHIYAKLNKVSQSISQTRSMLPRAHKETVKEALKQRKQKPSQCIIQLQQRLHTAPRGVYLKKQENAYIRD